ncbi:hypothetical protein P43SY_005917 [Pythium insidiosum]|uniref:Uncharacterized protein n=1 Tax=Pythium insidiosum TaxID=114742 RepID=A0AAD5Q7D9_PYTIN|nr:hypothetical protein P43SY_005917 [Pythium insidiosum]
MDVLIITLAVQAGLIVSNYFWYLYLVIPGYLLYLGGGLVLNYVFTPDPKDTEELDPAAQKRKEKAERRASRPKFRDWDDASLRERDMRRLIVATIAEFEFEKFYVDMMRTNDHSSPAYAASSPSTAADGAAPTTRPTLYRRPRGVRRRREESSTAIEIEELDSEIMRQNSYNYFQQHALRSVLSGLSGLTTNVETGAADWRISSDSIGSMA